MSADWMARVLNEAGCRRARSMSCRASAPKSVRRWSSTTRVMSSRSPARRVSAARSRKRRAAAQEALARTGRQERLRRLRRRRSRQGGEMGRAPRPSPMPASAARRGAGSSSSTAVYDAFVDKFLAATKALKLGVDDDCDLGPVINERQLANMLGAVDARRCRLARACCRRSARRRRGSPPRASTSSRP